MTVIEIIQQVQDEWGERNQITLTQSLLYMNLIQQLAFGEDKLSLLSYGNLVDVTEGQLNYNFPAFPTCRKLVGITKAEPERIMMLPTASLGASTGIMYGDVELNYTENAQRAFYEKILVDLVGRMITFVDTPVTTPDTYRWVYYRGAPNINTKTDDTNLILMEQFHWTVLVQGMLKLADSSLYSKKSSDEVLRPILKPFWDFLDQANDLGNRTQYNNQGQPLT